MSLFKNFFYGLLVSLSTFFLICNSSNSPSLFSNNNLNSKIKSADDGSDFIFKKNQKLNLNGSTITDVETNSEHDMAALTSKGDGFFLGVSSDASSNQYRTMYLNPTKTSSFKISTISIYRSTDFKSEDVLVGTSSISTSSSDIPKFTGVFWINVDISTLKISSEEEISIPNDEALKGKTNMVCASIALSGDRKYIAVAIQTKILFFNSNVGAETVGYPIIYTGSVLANRTSISLKAASIKNPNKTIDTWQHYGIMGKLAFNGEDSIAAPLTTWRHEGVDPKTPPVFAMGWGGLLFGTLSEDVSNPYVFTNIGQNSGSVMNFSNRVAFDSNNNMVISSGIPNKTIILYEYYQGGQFNQTTIDSGLPNLSTLNFSFDKDNNINVSTKINYASKDDPRITTRGNLYHISNLHGDNPKKPDYKVADWTSKLPSNNVVGAFVNSNNILFCLGTDGTIVQQNNVSFDYSKPVVFFDKSTGTVQISSLTFNILNNSLFGDVLKGTDNYFKLTLTYKKSPILPVVKDSVFLYSASGSDITNPKDYKDFLHQTSISVPNSSTITLPPFSNLVMGYSYDISLFYVHSLGNQLVSDDIGKYTFSWINGSTLNNSTKRVNKSKEKILEIVIPISAVILLIIIYNWYIINKKRGKRNLFSKWSSSKND